MRQTRAPSGTAVVNRNLASLGGDPPSFHPHAFGPSRAGALRLLHCSQMEAKRGRSVDSFGHLRRSKELLCSKQHCHGWLLSTHSSHRPNGLESVLASSPASRLPQRDNQSPGLRSTCGSRACRRWAAKRPRPSVSTMGEIGQW